MQQEGLSDQHHPQSGLTRSEGSRDLIHLDPTYLFPTSSHNSFLLLRSHFHLGFEHHSSLLLDSSIPDARSAAPQSSSAASTNHNCSPFHAHKQAHITAFTWQARH